MLNSNRQPVYVPPPFEEIQHDVTKVDKDNLPLELSFHSDVSLLQRIDRMSLSAQQIGTLRDQLQPMIDSSNFRDEFESCFGSLSDDELIRTCPSRYIQTLSEQKSYLSELASKHSEERKKYIDSLKDERLKKDKELQETEFQSKIRNLLSNL